MINAKEVYIASRNSLREVEKLIREGASQKEINKSFLSFQKSYLESVEAYATEQPRVAKKKRGVPMLDTEGKTTFTKKKVKNAPRMLVTKY